MKKLAWLRFYFASYLSLTFDFSYFKIGSIVKMLTAGKLGLTAACGAAAYGSYHCMQRILIRRDKQLANSNVLTRFR
ncbi:MAG: hypothetical protein H0X02_08065 [Nitrosomonas sp.]|nr:hypothetical protein [Nitrosomonas sp.]